MIPVPKFSFSSASRPSSAMSNYGTYDNRPGSSMSFRTSAVRAQTPESALRSRVAQLPFYHEVKGTPSTHGTASASMTPPSLRRQSRLPPSSFRDSAASSTAPSSRPSSRASFDGHHRNTYGPPNAKDPLDVEVAAIVNSLPHGLLIERVDPPLRSPPVEGEEIKAQYAFSNHISRKVVACRLLIMNRSGTKTKKVMCRVGGGWQDLQLYILNRQAGM